jgi:putative xylitol transport system ATP-binding protein
MTALLLEATEVAKSFDGVPALKSAALTLRAGSVHALCGGNGAGKSTFLGILMGLLRRDAGEIRIKGQPVDFRSPADAIRHRVAIVTQELSPVPEMTVAENIFLGQEPRRCPGVIDTQALREQAQALLARLGFVIDADARMATLSLAQVQLVEIARALREDAEILILDEPTSAIGEQETHVLFNAIRGLTTAGTGVIYVSHRLTEIFEIADSYTVMRNGSFVESGALSDIDRPRLIRAIVGTHVAAERPARREAGGPAVLAVRGLARADEFQQIDLTVRAGEIVGIYGLMGSGRTELLNCVYGLTRPDAGTVQMNGQPVPPGRPRASLDRAMALVTEDRKETGLVLSDSIARNISLSILSQLQQAGWISASAERSLVEDLIQRLRIKAASPQQPVGSLSGGNQQKVVVARCLSTKPRLLLCDEPTRGMDEGAKQEIYQQLHAFTAAGGAVLVVSSEIPEVLQLSDRVLVFKHGRIAATLGADDLSPESLTRAAT